jgi:lipoate-protein ligase A
MGNTNYCVIMPRDVFKRQTHVEMVARALNQLDIAAKVNGRHDITVYERKISFIFIECNWQH